MDLETQYEKLLRYCYMKTKNKFVAEDIVQETRQWGQVHEKWYKLYKIILNNP